jgi:hypothetical protein
MPDMRSMGLRAADAARKLADPASIMGNIRSG